MATLSDKIIMRCNFAGRSVWQASTLCKGTCAVDFGPRMTNGLGEGENILKDVTLPLTGRFTLRQPVQFVSGPGVLLAREPVPSKLFFKARAGSDPSKVGFHVSDLAADQVEPMDGRLADTDRVARLQSGRGDERADVDEDQRPGHGWRVFLVVDRRVLYVVLVLLVLILAYVGYLDYLLIR